VSRRAAAPVALLATLLILALLAGCGGAGGSSGAGGSEATQTTTQVAVQTASEGFNAAEVYREASPGVVTIRSIFDEGGAEGSGFVLDSDGRIVTNAHVVTDGEGNDRKEAKAVFIEFSNRNVVPA
jgi:putative serine protease PepD